LFCPQGRLYRGRELTPRIYHRFTVDEGNDITAMRLFQDEPKWTPYSRAEGGTDSRESRHEYIKSVAVAA
jgi:1,2-dihydroxy-3-keto-5-methylthiopentene dioxygenase